MPHQKVQLPQFPEVNVYLSYHNKVSADTLATVKEQLINRNEKYDFCFLSTSNIVSLKQLRSALYTAVRKYKQGAMKSSSVYTEVIYSLSPVNNINEALKRFGVDESRTDIIVIKISSSDIDFNSLEESLSGLLNSKSAELTDEVLFSKFDSAKFKKLFKLQEAQTQEDLTQGAIESSLIRGL